MKFTDSKTCKCHSHCKTCRDLENGRQFRKGLSPAFEIDTVDFTCPYNIPWGGNSMIVEPKTLITPLVKIEKNCDKCDNFNGNVCELKFPKGCCHKNWKSFLEYGICPICLIGDNMKKLIIGMLILLMPLFSGCGNSVTGAKVEINKDRLEKRDTQTTIEIDLSKKQGETKNEVKTNSIGTNPNGSNSTNFFRG